MRKQWMPGALLPIYFVFSKLEILSPTNQRYIRKHLYHDLSEYNFVVDLMTNPYSECDLSCLGESMFWLPRQHETVPKVFTHSLTWDTDFSPIHETFSFP